MKSEMTPERAERLAFVRQCAADGLTLHETARLLGVQMETVYEYALKHRIIFRRAPVLKARIEQGVIDRHEKFTPPPPKRHWQKKKRLPVQRRFCATCGDEIPVMTHPSTVYICPRCGQRHRLKKCRYCGRRFAERTPRIGNRAVYCGSVCAARYWKRRHEND